MPQVYSKTKTHHDDDGDVIPEPGAGTDTHEFKVPSGQSYSHCKVESLSGHALSGYSIKTKPRRGAKGKRRIKIDWWHAPFGKVKYRLRAYSRRDRDSSTAKPPAQKISFGAAGWVEEALAAAQQGLDFTIVVKGPLATELKGHVQQHTAAFAVVTPTVAVTITLAAAFVLVTLAGFATIGAVLIVAMQSGYNARGYYKGSSNPLSAEFEIRVTKS